MDKAAKRMLANADAWAKKNGRKSTPQPRLPDDPVSVANRRLRGSGWKILDLTINETSGYARLVLENRDTRSRKGKKVTVLRSSHASKAVVERSVIELRSGMYESYWEVVDTFGHESFEGMKAALRATATYISDNSDMSRLDARNAVRPIAGSV